MLKKSFKRMMWGLFKIYPQRFINILKDNYYKYQIQKHLPRIDNSSFIDLNCYIVGGDFISIGEKSRVHKNTVLTAWNQYGTQYFKPEIKIGKNVIIGEYGHITAINKIIIEDGVLTGHHVTITDNSHGLSTIKELQMEPINRPLYSKGPVIIDKNVWIGDKVTILPNVHIGEGCIIAANAVVVKDIPPYSIVAGIPGKIIKTIGEDEK